MRTRSTPLFVVLIFVSLCFIVLAFPSSALSHARGIVLSDQELDKVFARGLNFNFGASFARSLGRLSFAFRLSGSVSPADHSKPFAVNIGVGGPNPIVSVQAGGSGNAGNANVTVSNYLAQIAEVSGNVEGSGASAFTLNVGDGSPVGTAAQSLVEVNAIKSVVRVGLDLVVQGVQGIGSGVGSLIRSALTGGL